MFNILKPLLSKSLISQNSLNLFKKHATQTKIWCQISSYNKLSSLSSNVPQYQEVIDDESSSGNKIIQETCGKINEQLEKKEEGRLFAVVHICGKQFKITTEDIIILEGHWPPQNGDQIKLEKVMLVGGMDFTLVGRPILPQNLVSVIATVIEKDLSHTKTIFFKRRRKQYMRTNFYRSPLTMLRINEIKVTGKINESQDTQEYNRTF